MRYPKWFARWRLQVWDNRLADWRREFNQVTVAGPDRKAAEQAIDGVTQERFYERLVTHCLRKRVLWRKRAGIKLAQGGPVRRPAPTLPDPFRHTRDWRNH